MEKALTHFSGMTPIRRTGQIRYLSGFLIFLQVGVTVKFGGFVQIALRYIHPTLFLTILSGFLTIKRPRVLMEFVGAACPGD